MKRKIKIIFLCYHYIERQGDFKRLWAHSREQFKSHLDFLRKNYPPVDFNDVVSFVKGEAYNLSAKCSVLTFDDGLKEHCSFFAKYLDKLNLKAIFNIPACILRGEPSNPQIVHFGTAYYGIRNFFRFAKEEIKRIYPEEAKLFPDDKKLRLMAVREAMKKLFWRKLGCRITRETLMKIYERHIKKDFPGFMDDAHLNNNEIITLAKNGHSIGAHTDTHYNVKELYKDEEAFKEEVIKPKIKLEKLIGKKVEIFSYPFGAKADIISDPGVFEKIGYKAIFTAFQEERKLDLLNIGRYLVQSKDSIGILKNNTWEYEISNNK